jgi:hypothetical protein
MPSGDHVIVACAVKMLLHNFFRKVIDTCEGNFLEVVDPKSKSGEMNEAKLLPGRDHSGTNSKSGEIKKCQIKKSGEIKKVAKSK